MGAVRCKDVLVTAVLEGAGPGLGASLDVELDASVLAKVVDGSTGRGSGGGGSSGSGRRPLRHVGGVVVYRV